MKRILYFAIILSTLSSCAQKKQSEDDENKKIVYLKAREKSPAQPKEEIVESLMQELVKATDSIVEAKLMDSIWGYSRPIITDEPLNLSLRAIDSEGNQILHQLSAAVGEVKAKLTMSNDKGWKKSIEFKPISIYNLQGLMRE